MSNIAKPVVAVVDDDGRVLESLKDLLESGGYCALVFPSARAFLESDALPSISCLISDICMPAMNGWELEMRASHARPELPIILITGRDDNGQKVRTVRVTGPVRPLFKKPFNGPELLTAVGAAVGAASLLR
jgi:FixJ family two-component response regulator